MLFYIFCALSGVVYYFDIHKIVYENVKDSIQEFKTLNSFIENKKHNKCKSFIESCKTVGKTIWVNILHKLNKSIEHVDKHSAVITYVMDGRLYKFVVGRRRGPKKIFLIYDENDEDVSDLILPFLGPERNWHEKVFTPEFWGKNKLIFETTNGESKAFEKGEKLSSF